MKMTKTDEVKALEEKKAFFDAKIKERRNNQYAAIIKGSLIIVSVLLFDCFIAPLLGLIWMIIGVAILLVAVPLIIRFVWAPWDVCWVSVVKPNYCKVLVRGGELIRPIANGISFTEEWEPVSSNHPNAVFIDKSFWGVHIIKNWPFTQVYEDRMEYRRYNENLKSAPLKRELMVEFTLVVYPYYVEVLDAKDAKKADVRMGISWMARMSNVKKALFAEATSMIDVCTPLIVGGMSSFIQNHTVEQIRSLVDVGRTLYEEMPSPRPTNLQSPSGENLVEMMNSKYGMITESVSKIFFKGDNEEVEEAMNAKALAGFRRDAKLVDADAASRVLSMSTTGAAIDMLAQTVVHLDYVDDNEEEGEKRDPEEERKKALLKARNYLTDLKKDHPDEFKKKYGEQWEECLDLVRRDMAIKGESFSDARTPDSKGSNGDALSLLLTAEMVGNRKSKSSPDPKEKKGKDDKRVDFFKGLGVREEDINK